MHGYDWDFEWARCLASEKLVYDMDAGADVADDSAGVLYHITYERAKMFAEAFDQGVDVGRFAFKDEFHAAVIEVADGTGQGEVFTELHSGHAKADSLDAAAEKDRSTNFGHGGILTEK